MAGWNVPPVDMRILSWNYRGLGNSDSVNILKSLVKTENPNFIFLIKTKIGKKWMKSICKILGFGDFFLLWTL